MKGLQFKSSPKVWSTVWFGVFCWWWLFFFFFTWKYLFFGGGVDGGGFFILTCLWTATSWVHNQPGTFVVCSWLSNKGMNWPPPQKTENVYGAVDVSNLQFHNLTKWHVWFMSQVFLPQFNLVFQTSLITYCCFFKNLSLWKFLFISKVI